MSRNQLTKISSPAWVRGSVYRGKKFSVRFEIRIVVVTVTLLVLSAVIGALALTVGSAGIPIADVLAAFFGQDVADSTKKIVLDVRLPRVVTGIFVGAALGISGSIFQSISRNALGSPDVIGFTTGAASGAILQIIIFDSGPIHTALFAITGGILTAIVVYALSVKHGVTGGYRLVLTGIGVGSVLSALNSLLLVKGSLDNAIAANLWLAGSLNVRNWFHAVPVMVGVIIILPFIVAAAKKLNLIEMGDDFAQQFGVSVERTRLLMITGAVLLASLATGAAGPVAFIALAAPQLVKWLTKAHDIPVISAAAMGSTLVVVADIISQLVPFNINLPIGRMTGLLGGIYLIWLLTRSKQV